MSIDDEFYKRDAIASAAAPSLALTSVQSMDLPKVVQLSGNLKNLGFRAASQAQRVLGQLNQAHGENVPALVGIALRETWFACWKSAHYIRLLHEQLPKNIAIPASSKKLWTAEGYAARDGWTGTLWGELSRIEPAPERLQFLVDTPFHETPDESSILQALSVYCFHEADRHASAGRLDSAFDLLHDAYDAVHVSHETFMWNEAVAHGREIAATAAATAARTSLAKSAAAARHLENRSMKQDVFKWCDENMTSMRSMDAAASLVAGAIVPAAWRTVRDWMTEWKKLRSAGTA